MTPRLASLFQRSAKRLRGELPLKYSTTNDKKNIFWCVATAGQSTVDYASDGTVILNTLSYAGAMTIYFDMQDTNNQYSLGPGDFDVSMMYRDLSLPSVEVGYAAWFQFRAWEYAAGSLSGMTIERYNKNSIPAIDTIRAFTTNSSEAASSFVICPTDALASGGFRVRRSGTTMTAYYLSGGAWNLLRTRTGATTGPCMTRVELRVNTSPSAPARGTIVSIRAVDRGVL